MSIIATLCCCWPFGIVGVILSIMAANHFKKGNDVEASKKLKAAKFFTFMAFLFGFLMLVGAGVYFMMVYDGDMDMGDWSEYWNGEDYDGVEYTDTLSEEPQNEWRDDRGFNDDRRH
jgi:hypothetical protein